MANFAFLKDTFPVLVNFGILAERYYYSDFNSLIDKNMKRKNLQEAAGISSAIIAKLRKGDIISMDVLIKICGALDCKRKHNGNNCGWMEV